MSFARPGWLPFALVALLVVAWFYRRLEARRAAQALVYSNLEFALGAMRPSRWPSIALFALCVLGIGALLAALAGPNFFARVPVKDGTVVICIDTSGSMRATDLLPTRAFAAKSAALAFLDAVPAGTRVGLVTFATGASLIQAPTSDLDAARSALERIPPPDGATAIGDALALAAQQMPGKGARAVVLLTDGVNNRGVEPVETSIAIGRRGIAIDTVGVGTNDSGLLIPGTSEPAALDEDALRAIATNANGAYASAQDTASLRATFRNLALETVWEKKRIDGSLPVALGGGFVLVATLLLGLAAGRFP